MDVINNKPGVVVASPMEVSEIEDLMREEEDSILEAAEEGDCERINSSLSAHILQVFKDNRDSRSDSGIEKKMLESLRAYNGHYDPEDIARIRQSGGSEIYMNLTPTKCRAAMSWMRDILLAAKEKSWSIEPTPIPELPQEIKDKVQAEIEKIIQQIKENNPQGQGVDAAASIQETTSLRRDFEEALSDSINSLAKYEVSKFERIIEDQLVEGKWEEALSNFIEDFCVFQVAIMKGPIVSKKKKISWNNGERVIDTDYVFLNKRVSPLDIYPSASATCINDGNLCEHIRLSRSELYSLIGVQDYKEEDIRYILQNDSNANGISTIVDNYIEDEKTTEEFRGDTYRANRGVYHGVHYHGSASYSHLIDWGFSEDDLGDDEDKEFEVEAILVGDRVIKCVINDDPLLRRPYYKASFQNIPGSWWGRSLPELMRDIQRMCNATARALANNMAVAAGPQIEVYIERLAADVELTSVTPFKIWQVTSDPTGAGGRAVQFWQPSSNAGELLTVYKEFELRADDATGIPRYAYGNERTGAAAQTASGLSMLLESASKGIKDAIRHIDDGLIKPRVEYQFYLNMLSDNDSNFTGDVVIQAKGSQALTMKGAQELRRNEFLQIIANPAFSGIVGIEGFAEILRDMAKSLGFGNNIIPSRIELKKRLKEQQAQQQQLIQQQQQMESQKSAVGIEQVKMQVSQAEAASQRSAQLKAAELQMDAEDKMQKNALKAAELEQQRESDINKNTTALTKQQIQSAQADRSDNKNIALSIQSGYQDKSNIQ